MLKGKKTYLAAVAGVIVVAATHFQGMVDPTVVDPPTLAESAKLAIGYLTAIFLRKGIKSDTGN